MIGEVMMDLIQPRMMSNIVDNGVKSTNTLSDHILHLCHIVGHSGNQLTVTGARVVKAYVREEYEKERFGSANTEPRKMPFLLIHSEKSLPA